jgi:hypothetical protein
MADFPGINPPRPALGQPPWGYPEATLRLSGGQPVGTLKPPSGYPEATPRLPRGYPEATPRLPWAAKSTGRAQRVVVLERSQR